MLFKTCHVFNPRIIKVENADNVTQNEILLDNKKWRKGKPNAQIGYMKCDKHLEIEITINVEENGDKKWKEKKNNKFTNTMLVSVLTDELQILTVKMKTLKFGRFFGTLAGLITLFWTSVRPSVRR